MLNDNAQQADMNDVFWLYWKHFHLTTAPPQATAGGVPCSSAIA